MYLSKEILLASFKKLSELDHGNYAQGLTKKVSFIRHFLAFDEYCKQKGVSELDANVTEAKKSFTECVGRIVSVSPDFYTPNFIEVENIPDFRVGTNFFAGGPILKSATSQDTLTYPMHGDALLSVQQKKVTLSSNAYDSISKYLYDENIRVALAIWIGRTFNAFTSAETIYSELKGSLGQIYSDSLLNKIFPCKDRFDAYFSELNLELLSEKEAEFSEDDFNIKGSVPTPPEQKIDTLTIALKLFKEERKGDWRDNGYSINGKTREFYSQYTADKIDNMQEDGIREFFLHRENLFRSMWSGCEGQGWSHINPNNDVSKVQCERAYIKRLFMDASLASTYWSEGRDAHPSGFGPSVVTEILMKFHPAQCIKHGRSSREALEFLKLIEISSPFKSAYTEEEYSMVRGAATVILGKMKAMSLPRLIDMSGEADDNEPDYLTVNEFLWWVSEHKDLIKEKVMSKKMKKVEQMPKYGEKKIQEAFKDDELMKRLLCALRTKPFAILAGHSGTGKSRMVRKLAYMTCCDHNLLAESEENSQPGNFRMIQVKPNWHDSTDLLGYYSEYNGRHYQTTPFVEFVCRAYAYPNVPFFVCLDEMNLAPVEHYFAEYLSALESFKDIAGVGFVSDPLVQVDREETNDGVKQVVPEIMMQIMGKYASKDAFDWISKHDLTLPKNLFVIGTVNVDETTRQFSRKVLDRAMTIMMDEVDFNKMGDSEEPEAVGLLNEEGIKFLNGRKLKCGKLEETALGCLKAVKGTLDNSPFAIAYRFANEYGLYQEALKELQTESNRDIAREAMDHLVLMKVLPRIHGVRNEVEKYFDGITSSLTQEKLTKERIEKIKKYPGDYLSFWP